MIEIIPAVSSYELPRRKTELSKKVHRRARGIPRAIASVTNEDLLAAQILGVGLQGVSAIPFASILVSAISLKTIDANFGKKSFLCFRLGE